MARLPDRSQPAKQSDVVLVDEARSSCRAGPLLATAPFISGTRSVEIANDKGNKPLAEKMQKAATEELLPTLEFGLFPSCECLPFGHWLQEVIWQSRKGRIVPEVVTNSVLPTEGQLFCDRQRHFAGFQIGQQFRDKRYGWLSVNEPHIHPVLGYSRCEYVKKDWWSKINGELAADKMSARPAGFRCFSACRLARVSIR